MSFDHLMVPLIVIAPELGKSEDGKYPELRDHYEIVLFYQGINIWHHRYKDGKLFEVYLSLQNPLNPNELLNLKFDNPLVNQFLRGNMVFTKAESDEFIALFIGCDH